MTRSRPRWPLLPLLVLVAGGHRGAMLVIAFAAATG